MKSSNPTRVALSYWWKHRMWVGWVKKITEPLVFLGIVVVAMILSLALVLFFLDVLFSSLELFDAVWYGHAGTYISDRKVVEGYLFPGFFFLESLGLSHRILFSVIATFLGSMALGSVVGFFLDYVPFARWKKGYWVVAGGVGLPFVAWGFAVLLAVTGVFLIGLLGLLLWNGGRALVRLPVRLRAKRDAFLISHPEAMAIREKQVIEGKFPSSTKSSTPSRL